ncbi:hypothetical protein X740_01000 [Mesorhizobium sp. LNHC221B00]|nr:hypothetical protein X740_01000 [Mesorhizobium sp. LNHC221B00]
MAFLGALLDMLFVDLDAQARTVGNGDIAVLVAKDVFVGGIVEQVVAGIVMDAEALLLGNCS